MDDTKNIQITLRFLPGNPDQIHWNIHGQDGPTSNFCSPYAGDDLRIVIKALEFIQNTRITFDCKEKEVLKRLGLWSDWESVRNDASTIVGRKLYDALFERKDDNDGHTTYSPAYYTIQQVFNEAIKEDCTISYVLRIPAEAVQLAALPWELIHKDRGPLLFLRGGQDVDSMVRYVELDGHAIPTYAPLVCRPHILVLAPYYGMLVSTYKEAQQQRNDALRKLEGLLTWDELSPVTADSLYNRMHDDTKPVPDIIHYFGHGSYQNGVGSLLFDGDDHGNTVKVMNVNDLSPYLGKMRLLLLQACHSGMVGVEGDGLRTGIAPALSLISQAVVGMQLSVRVDSAIRFQEVFYRQIASGKSLQSAVAEARQALYNYRGSDGGWYIPTLYIRSREREPIFLVKRKG